MSVVRTRSSAPDTLDVRREMHMTKIERRTGAIRDKDAFFVCIAHSDSPNLMQHLRAHRIKFTIDVEPDPPEDQSDEDIFWFEHTADIERLQKLIDEVLKKGE
jgi:hypothetical protein